MGLQTQLRRNARNCVNLQVDRVQQKESINKKRFLSSRHSLSTVQRHTHKKKIGVLAGEPNSGSSRTSVAAGIRRGMWGCEFWHRYEGVQD